MKLQSKTVYTVVIPEEFVEEFSMFMTVGDALYFWQDLTYELNDYDEVVKLLKSILNVLERYRYLDLPPSQASIEWTEDVLESVEEQCKQPDYIEFLWEGTKRIGEMGY